MNQHLVCCGILQREVALLLEGGQLETNDVQYLPAGLHVDLDKLKASIEEALASKGDSLCRVSSEVRTPVAQELMNLGYEDD